MARIFATLFILIVSASASAAGKTSFEGHYWNEAKDGIFKLQLTNSGIEGITVWGKKPQKDIHNPDPVLRERSLKGITFLWGFEYNAKKNRWHDGRVYDPETGKTYDAKISLEKNGSILKMRGYMGISMFGRTAKFERVKPEDLQDAVDQNRNQSP